ncbi:hypothetical protein T439DRAFT_320874 [Meredithblackwellia eburnea MCA 4105]
MRASLIRFAKHVQARKPSMHFPDRKAQLPHHPPSPHAYAPQAIIDSFAQFQQRQASPSPVPLSGPAGGHAPRSDLPPADLEGDWQLPKRFRRNYGWQSLEEGEIDAVLSGGATEATPVTKAYKQKWYTAQI